MAGSHVDYPNLIDYVEDEVNDVPDLIDANGNVYDGAHGESGKITVTGGVGIEGCTGCIGCSCSRCSPKGARAHRRRRSLWRPAQQPQLVVEGDMTVKGAVVFSKRNAELAQVQTSVDAVMSKLNELGAVLEHVEQMAVSDTSEWACRGYIICMQCIY